MSHYVGPTPIGKPRPSGGEAVDATPPDPPIAGIVPTHDQAASGVGRRAPDRLGRHATTPSAGDWFRLHRSIMDSRVFQNEGLLKVWIWCLCRANWKRCYVAITTGRGSTEVELQPGQFIFGRATAAKALRMKSATVQDRMRKLVDIKNIIMQPVTHYSIVTICNWATYQEAQTEARQEDRHPSINQPSPKHQPTITQASTKHHRGRR
jgi:hypothetical protein